MKILNFFALVVVFHEAIGVPIPWEKDWYITAATDSGKLEINEGNSAYRRALLFVEAVFNEDSKGRAYFLEKKPGTGKGDGIFAIRTRDKKYWKLYDNDSQVHIGKLSEGDAKVYWKFAVTPDNEHYYITSLKNCHKTPPAEPCGKYLRFDVGWVLPYALRIGDAKQQWDLEKLEIGR